MSFSAARKKITQESKTKKKRHFVFTKFNSDAKTVDALFTVPQEQIRWAAWQIELCPTTLRPHIQGAFCASYPIILSAAKRWCGCSFVEPSLTADSGVAYCSKPESRAFGPFFWPNKEACNRAKSKPRTDYVELARLVQQGKRFEDLAVNPTWAGVIARSGAHFRRIEHSFGVQTRREEACQVIWCEGPPGTGKTTILNLVLDYLHPGQYYFKGPSRNTWDGYHGQPFVYAEEPQATAFGEDFGEWLKLVTSPGGCDTRILYGTSEKFTSQILWICTNKKLHEFFTADQLSALRSRMSRGTFTLVKFNVRHHDK